MKVGVFDSGVGGLSVLKSLLNARLFDEIVYFGDTARVPYGVKDKETIVRFSLEALDFFKPFCIDMLIIACNTVSAYALKALRANSNIPILGVIDAGVLAVNKALADKDSQILVIATKATINSKRYQKRLANAGFKHIEALATGLFVPMVEEGIFEGELVQSAFRHYFSALCKKPLPRTNVAYVALNRVYLTIMHHKAIWVRPLPAWKGVCAETRMHERDG